MQWLRSCVSGAAILTASLRTAALRAVETIGKTVGRRKPPSDSFRYAMGLQKTLVELNMALGGRFVPKVVFRFHTHEETDEWMLKMLARRRE